MLRVKPHFNALDICFCYGAAMRVLNEPIGSDMFSKTPVVALNLK